VGARVAIRVTGGVAAAILTTGCTWLGRGSVSSAPSAAQADAGSHHPSVSRLGRYVAFDSTASNLVPGDTNGVADVFVHDNVARTTERVSVTSAGAQVTGASVRPSISDDGRFVAFESNATDLAPDGSDGGNSDVFLHDRAKHTTVLVSVGDDEAPIIEPASRAVVSGDGGTVAFETLKAREVVDIPPLPSLPMGPWVRAVAASRTRLMQPAGPSALIVVSDYDLSDDGSRILYSETDIVGGLTSTGYVGDTALGTITSSFAAGTPVWPGTLRPTLVAISGDGTRFAHLANPSTGTGTVATILTGPTATPASTDPPIMLPPSRTVALSTDGTRLFVETDIFGVPVGLVRAATDTRWTIVSYTADGRRLIPTPESEMAASGRWFAFASADAGLVPNDTNGVADVFTRSFDVDASPS